MNGVSDVGMGPAAVVLSEVVDEFIFGNIDVRIIFSLGIESITISATDHIMNPALARDYTYLDRPK